MISTQSDGHADEREMRGDDAGRSEPEDVREPQPRNHLLARARDAQQRQQACADREVERVRDQQPGQRSRHVRTRAA